MSSIYDPFIKLKVFLFWQVGSPGTVEAQTAEEAKCLSKTELRERKPVIDLQMPASRNLAINRNINQFQR